MMNLICISDRGNDNWLIQYDSTPVIEGSSTCVEGCEVRLTFNL